MQLQLPVGQRQTLVSASRRRPAARNHPNASRSPVCTAVIADGWSIPSTSQPDQPEETLPGFLSIWQRIVSAKGKPEAPASGQPAVLKRLFAGGLRNGPLLLSAVPAAIIPPSAWDQLGGNYVFMAGFCGWFIAQFLKIFTKWYKTGIFSFRAFVDSGGMPSSHSSLCSAVTTAVALQQGLGSPLFAMCTCFSVIVMYDAMGVRRHAGLQAEVLNAVVEDLLEHHPVSERKLKEVLGHTPRQVLCGAVLGLLVGLVYPRPF